MKKSILVASIALSAMMASCALWLPQLRLSGAVVIGEPQRKTNLVQISVQPKWDNPGKGNKKISSFYVEFRNPSPTPEIGRASCRERV